MNINWQLRELNLKIVYYGPALSGKTTNLEQIHARVVSMPSWELFLRQPKKYRDEVLPPDVKARLAVEAGSPLGWRNWVGDGGDIIGISRFGASAPYKEIFKHFGFTIDNVVESARKLLGK